MIALHAVATTNPQQLHWVIPQDGRLPVGTVRRAPGALGDWLERRVITELVIRDTGVWITLGAENSWRIWGDRVRDALAQALQDPSGWHVEHFDDAAGLVGIVRELLDGQIGAFAQSHGGSIELVSVTGYHVTVRMSGTCDGCPASGSTLHDRLQHELRRRAGDQVTVSRAPSRGRRLPWRR